MKYILTIVALLLLSGSVYAWNLSAMNINALRFQKDGRIQFTLFDSGASGTEFECGTGSRRQWFYVSECSGSNAQCLASANRIASMLLSAKLAGKKVHVQRSGCEVTEVALKP